MRTGFSCQNRQNDFKGRVGIVGPSPRPSPLTWYGPISVRARITQQQLSIALNALCVCLCVRVPVCVCVCTTCLSDPTRPQNKQNSSKNIGPSSNSRLNKKQGGATRSCNVSTLMAGKIGMLHTPGQCDTLQYNTRLPDQHVGETQNAQKYRRGSSSDVYWRKKSIDHIICFANFVLFAALIL